MEEAALKQAEKAAERVRRAVAALGSATDLAEAGDAWEDCLAAVSRVYEKLKAGTRDHAASRAWFGAVTAQRRDDELLCYVHHARNTDSHRFDEVVSRVPGGLAIGSQGAIHLRGMIIARDGRVFADWSPASPGAQLTVTPIADRLNVVPVTDRGVEYAVPTMHLGRAVPDHDVLTIARAAAAYVESMLADVRALRG